MEDLKFEQHGCALKEAHQEECYVASKRGKNTGERAGQHYRFYRCDDQ
jgi:hypothetical protein